MAGGKVKVYSFEEVRKHNDRKDCWLIISGKVYDVTRFMEEHPGGDEILLACTGKDATADFVDVGHTDSARALMPEYCIGEVDAATVPAKAAPKAGEMEAEAALKRGEGPGVWLMLAQVAVPVLLLGTAFALQNFAKAKAE